MSAKRFKTDATPAHTIDDEEFKTGVYPAATSDAAPRPIGVDPSETGSFSTIRAREGAVLSTRKTAGREAEAVHTRRMRSQLGKPRRATHVAEAPLTSQHKKLVALGGGSLTVVLLILALFAAFGFFDKPAPKQDVDGRPSITTVTNNTSVMYGGYTYSTSQSTDGTWVFESTGREDPIYTFEGTPVSVALFGGVFYIAENLPDNTWDVICYMPADGSVASQMLNTDNQPVVGEGSLTSSTVENNKLVLIDSKGTKTVMPLV